MIIHVILNTITGNCLKYQINMDLKINTFYSTVNDLKYNINMKKQNVNGSNLAWYVKNE